MAGLNWATDISLDGVNETENCWMNRLWVCAGSAGA
jgi:hypothetical protein